MFEIYFKDAGGSLVEISNLSSGEQQIIYRLGFILKNIESLDGGLIFIDEPELSLHPKWQLRFKKLLLEIFKGIVQAATISDQLLSSDNYQLYLSICSYLEYAFLWISLVLEIMLCSIIQVSVFTLGKWCSNFYISAATES